jgi:hypothetical protein
MRRPRIPKKKKTRAERATLTALENGATCFIPF